ncbi:TPA: YcfL family protein [Pasteurella multocida]|nr:YcfL family protein [Pasteurella multocida]HDR1506958.1 YcfL family protein [Pasteurella multocida]
MKKLTALFISSYLLAGCGSHQPVNLLHTHQPILNIEADAHQLVEAHVSPTLAWVKNKYATPIQLTYQVFWYDKQGVSQATTLSDNPLGLQEHEKYIIPLNKPTAESQNYRLYLRLK